MGFFKTAIEWLAKRMPDTPPLPPLPKFPALPGSRPVIPAPYKVPTSLDQPPFPPLVTNADRMAIFGHFHYEDAPTDSNPEAIRITDGWQHQNIIFVPIPQMRYIPGAETNRDAATGQVAYGMPFHRLGAHQLQGMWAEWESAGLLDRVKTFEGSFVARYVRGSRTNLSNHCFGNAFDINYDWNHLGAEPAQFGERGSVRELVPISIKWGFYWGGFYHSRKDGMHFEVAKLLP